MDDREQVNKRKIPFIIYDTQPKPIIECKFFFWNINRVCKGGQQLAVSFVTPEGCKLI